MPFITTNNVTYRTYLDDLRDLRHWENTDNATIGDGPGVSCSVNTDGITGKDEFINLWNWKIMYYDDGYTAFKLSVIDRLRTSYITGDVSTYIVNDGTTSTTGGTRSAGWKTIDLFWEQGRLKFVVNGVVQHSFTFTILPFKIKLENGYFKNIEIYRKYRIK